MYVNDSSEEGSTYKPSEPGHEEGEGGGKERGEEEVCLSHKCLPYLSNACLNRICGMK